MWMARTAKAAGVVLVAFLLVFLWPQRLGGKSELLVVHGDSMEPAFANGDIVLVRSRDSYHVGDSVVFRVPRVRPRGCGSCTASPPSTRRPAR